MAIASRGAEVGDEAAEAGWRLDGVEIIHKEVVAGETGEVRAKARILPGVVLGFNHPVD